MSTQEQADRERREARGMTLADVVAEVQRIKAMRGIPIETSLWEANQAEAALRARFIGHVAEQGAPELAELAEMAREVLRVDDIVFTGRRADLAHTPQEPV